MSSEDPVSSGLSPPVWGNGRDSMNAFESLMWRVEEVSSLRSTMLAIETLAETPRWEDFVGTHERLVRSIPRLRQRVVVPPGRVALPRWTFDPSFDLHFHVRRARVGGDGHWSDLLAAASHMAMSGFDRSRPPWEAVLYEGLPDGRAAYVLKMHHAIADGVGVMAMFAHLHTAASSAHPEPAAVTRERTLNRFDAAREDAFERARGAPGMARSLGLAAIRRATAPAHAARSSRDYAASLRRVMKPPAAPASPLLAGRSRTWRLAALDLDFPSLRAAAKAADGSINDAYLAALLSGYRRYHEKLGHPVDVIPIGMPISLRSAEDAVGGNEIASARFAGPVGVEDPRERIALIKEMVRAARSEPAMNNINVVAPMLARLPPAAAARILRAATSANDLQASNVAGAREPVELAGVSVESLHCFAPLPGCPAMIALSTQGGAAGVAINFDPASFTEPELFVQCLAEGFDEVLALAPGTAPATRCR